MIIVRSPLRITLGGGGTDLPSYYEQHPGLCLAAAIDRYVYITLHETFVDELIVKYSQIERVATAADLKHPIVREALAGITGQGLEIASHADIHAGTGLGSSGAFTCALLGALYTYQGKLLDKWDLARQACEIEIDRLHEPIGKQDQYIAAFGGIQSLKFTPDRVRVEPIKMPQGTRYALEDNLLLFFTGYTRSASDVLARPLQADNLSDVRAVASGTLKALTTGNLSWFARLLSEQWYLKRCRSSVTSNADIDAWYTLGMCNGALGGKLIGAGGGGFLMFYAEDRTRLRQAMTDAGLREVRFRFDSDGTRVLTS